MTRWTITPTPVADPAARGLIRQYIAEVAGRYWGRTATDEEIDAVLADKPADGLEPPHGRFLVARLDGVPSGCAGVRRADAGVAVLTKVFVRPQARGRGGGGLLITAAEDAARELGATMMRLDTRGDLVEARGLYAKHGYTEIPAFNDDPYAEHWFEKSLVPGEGSASMA
ncbi:GNAT family N-acetyltransferase [Streptomyces capparidis]